MSTLFKDSFAGGSAADNLTTHSPLTGSTWSKTGIFTGDALIDGAGNAYVGSGGDAVASYSNATTHTDGDLYVTETFTLKSLINNHSQSFQFFQGASADTGYAVRLVGTAGGALHIDFYKFVAGTPTQFGSDFNVVTFAANDVYVISIVSHKVSTTRTFDISFTRNGGSSTTLFGGTVTDSSPITGTGHFGIRSAGSNTATTGILISEVLVTDDGTESVALTAGACTPVAATSTSVLVTGTAASGGAGFGATPYQFQKSANGTTGWTNVGSAVASATTGVTDSGLTTNDLWYYRYVVTDTGSNTANTAAAACAVRVATTYYFSATGNDSNTGTSSGSPWLSISKANSFKLTAGDTFAFKGGDSFSGSLRAQLCTGARTPTSALPVTLTSYGTGRATISCSNSYGVWSDNLPENVIRDLIITGSGVTFTAGSPNTVSLTTTDTGIKAINTGSAHLRGLVIDNCLVTGCLYGIEVGDNANVRSYGYTGLRVTNNVVHDCAVVGVRSTNATDYTVGIFTDPYFGYNHIYNIYGNWTGSVGGNSGYPLQVLNALRGIVEGNCCHDSGAATAPSGGGPTGIILVGCTSTIVRANEVFLQHTQTLDGSGIDLDGAANSCILEGNYIHECDGAAFELGTSSGTCTGNIIRFNVVQNCGRTRDAGILYTFNTPSANLFYQNTFYHSKAASGPAAMCAAGGGSNKWLNNIFIARGAATFGTFASTDTLAGNFYDATSFSIIYNSVTYTSLATLQAVAELVNGVATGISGTAALSSIGSGPTTATLPTNPISTITAYDPTSSSGNTVGVGIDIPSLYGLDVGECDFHRYPTRYGPSATSPGYDVGACKQGSSALLSASSTRLTITADGSNHPVLTWTEYPGAAHYLVLRSSTAQGAPTLVAVVTAPTLTYTDTSVTGGTQFYAIIATTG